MDRQDSNSSNSEKIEILNKITFANVSSALAEETNSESKFDSAKNCHLVQIQESSNTNSSLGQC